jgi:hypothetical protein
MQRRLVCLECEREFDEEDAEPFDGGDSLAESLSRVTTLDQLRLLVDPAFDDELAWVEVFCPNCGSDDLEDCENVAAIQEMKSH